MEYFVTAASSTTDVLARLLLPVLAAALVCDTASRILHRVTRAVLGARLHTWTLGLWGTVVHELTHLLAAIAFGHRIGAVKLFSLDYRSPVRGYVESAYDPSSQYQRAGLFFIGIAPVLLGGALLSALMYWLVPDLGMAATWIVNALLSEPDRLTTASEAAWLLLQPLTADPRVWIFLGLTLAIGDGMHVSSADVRIVATGIASISVALFLILVAALWYYPEAATWMSSRGATWVENLAAMLTTAAIVCVAATVAVAPILVVRMVLRYLPWSVYRSQQTQGGGHALSTQGRRPSPAQEVRQTDLR